MNNTARSILLRPVRAGVKLALRLNPFYRGGVRISQMPFVSRLTEDLRLVPTQLRKGPRILIEPNEYSGRAIYYTGDYDRRITWICKRLLRPGDCLLDIGANQGEVGLYAAQFVGPTGSVHIFEPQPKLANLIRVSAELNGFDHVHIHQIALSDREGQADLFVPQKHTGMGSLSRDNTGCGMDVDVLKVRTYRTGSYLQDLKLPPIRVIKMDVEGHEEQVIGGAMAFLRSNKPAAIVFECHDNGQPFFERGVVRLISSLGYGFFQLRQKIWLRVQIKRLTSNDSLETGYDFLALSNSPEHRDVYGRLRIGRI